MAKKLTITFCGGAENVTGANFLVETANTKVLIDCGLIQGSRICNPENEKSFLYDPAAINGLLVTHAHLDHIGRIPQLIKAGFRGKIYSTPPTKEISDISLVDSIGVLEKEAKRQHCTVLYSEADAAAALRQWESYPYYESFAVGDFLVRFKNAGHILGSAMVELTYAGKKFVFTGDLGSSPNILLPEADDANGADYLIMESVYGDRVHEDRQTRKEKLEDVIEDTVRAGGTLMIPAFSVERTQELLYEIESMMEESRIPLVPVFLDSPLAINVTRIYQKYVGYFKEPVRDKIGTGNTIFKFPQLHLSLTTEQSRAIKDFSQRKIVMAGSGMSNGGRIVHHEHEYLPDPKNTLLLIGYQAAGSLGRLLQEGAKEVNIFGDTVPVRARVETISGYSGHKDSLELLDFVRFSLDRLRKTFVVMGEPKASWFLTQRLRDYLGVDAVTPKLGERVELMLE